VLWRLGWVVRGVVDFFRVRSPAGPVGVEVHIWRMGRGDVDDVVLVAWVPAKVGVRRADVVSFSRHGCRRHGGVSRGAVGVAAAGGGARAGAGVFAYCRGRGCSLGGGGLLLFCFALEFLVDGFMPFCHFLVWFVRESFTRKDLREGSASKRVYDVKLSDGFLKERNLFIGVEEQLDGLPTDEACGREGGDSGWSEAIGYWLAERVYAA
jgi:hypothetical protein